MSVKYKPASGNWEVEVTDRFKDWYEPLTPQELKERI